ncbi:hypothetical protein [Psittacicella hinzii]|uniref:Uncharacterized protein n=1 Tax=Psittacicella hinzii TaxID=2028575 RepID=A0A3A1YH15_9GAMM|nr:hypothetical protein [Psittacicella hinzii]RIY37432.1 hypothetical protein CKF58_05080 [Psittacicella hinzii]
MRNSTLFSYGIFGTPNGFQFANEGSVSGNIIHTYIDPDKSIVEHLAAPENTSAKPVYVVRNFIDDEGQKQAYNFIIRLHAANQIDKGRPENIHGSYVITTEQIANSSINGERVVQLLDRLDKQQYELGYLRNNTHDYVESIGNFKTFEVQSLAQSIEFVTSRINYQGDKSKDLLVVMENDHIKVNEQQAIGYVISSIFRQSLNTFFKHIIVTADPHYIQSVIKLNKHLIVSSNYFLGKSADGVLSQPNDALVSSLLNMFAESSTRQVENMHRELVHRTSKLESELQKQSATYRQELQKQQQVAKQEFEKATGALQQDKLNILKQATQEKESLTKKLQNERNRVNQEVQAERNRLTKEFQIEKNKLVSSYKNERDKLVQEAKQRIQKLESELNNRSSAYSDLENKYKSLREESKAAKDFSKKCFDDKEAAVKREEELNRKFNQASKYSKDITEKYNALLAEREKLVEKLKEESEKLNNYSVFDKKLVEKDNEIKKLLEEIKELKDKNQVEVDKSKQLDLQIKHSSQVNERNKSTIKDLGDKLRDAKSLLDKQINSYKKLEEEKISLAKNYKISQDNVAKLRRDLTREVDRLKKEHANNFERAVISRVGQLKDLENKLKIEAANKDKRILDLESQLSLLRDSNSTLMQQAKNQVSAELTKEFEKQRRALIEKLDQNLINKLRELKVQHKKQIQQYELKQQSLEKELKEVNTRKETSLQERTNKLEQQYVAQSKELEKLRKNFRDSKEKDMEEISKLKAELQEERAKLLQNFSFRAEELSRKEKDFELEKSNFERREQAYKNDIEQFNNQKQQYENIIKSLNQSLKFNEDKVHRLEKELIERQPTSAPTNDHRIRELEEENRKLQESYKKAMDFIKEQSKKFNS